MRALQTKDGQQLQMSIVGADIWRVDSVKGDWCSVLGLARSIAVVVKQLPFMGEHVPRKWALVLTALKEAPEKVLQKQHTLAFLRANTTAGTDVASLTDSELWEAVQFWGFKGDVLVYGNVCVQNVPIFINLMRLLLHHKPIDSLGRATQCDKPFIKVC